MSDGTFCDYLTFSTPSGEWQSFREEIAPLFDSIGAQVEFDSERATQWRVGAGTCRAQRLGKVMVVSATGAFLVALRCAKLFNSYLATIGSHPHRVTRLDASRDEPHETPPVIESLVQRVASSEGVHVTRKRLKPEDCTRYVNRLADGRDTGSIYLGPKDADVRPVVYDKRRERLDAGLCDVGPLTRYECRIRSGVGPSLRDAAEPAAIFWHFMGEILPPPANAPEWTPLAEGFELARSTPDLPAARLVRRLQASADLRDIFRLAREVGPYGLDFLQRQIAELYEAEPAGPTALDAITEAQLIAAEAAEGATNVA